MPRKYNREQKEDAIRLLQDCEWTKTEHKKIEQSLYNKFRYERDEDKKREVKKMQFTNYEAFIKEYVDKITAQKGKCFYCGLEGDVKKHYNPQLIKIGMWDDGGFRKGKRGRSLEIDRIDSVEPYKNGNCVLACYPCNNAKSDVFTCEEFIVIGALIGALKQEKDEIIKNEFIQGLIGKVDEPRLKN